jgi:integrase
MARKATGQVIVRRGKTGVSFGLRFPAYGKRHYVTSAATDREGAERELGHLLADVERGLWAPPVREVVEPVGAESFHVYASAWLAARRPEVKARTVEHLTWALSCHLLPFFQHHRLGEITVSEVKRYRLAKLAERDDPKVDRPLSNATINRTVAVLAQILDAAIDEELLAVANPARGRQRRLKASKPRRTWLELDELRSLLDTAGNHRPLLATMAMAGLRVGEVCQLRWRDVKLASSELRVVDSKTDAGLRSVDVSPDLLDELKAHKQQTAPISDDELVFTTTAGTPRNRHNVRARVLLPAIKRANKKRANAGLPAIQDGVTNHTLRRTYCSLLYEAGASPAYVQGQMGHESAALALEVYARMMSRDRDTGARMDALVRGADWAQAGTNPTATDDTLPTVETVEAAIPLGDRP